MTQDTRDHRFLGHGGNDAECTAPAQGAGGPIQVKHAPQQPCPAPARCPSIGLTSIHTLLVWCRDDRPTQLTVRRQTSGIAHQVHPFRGVLR